MIDHYTFFASPLSWSIRLTVSSDDSDNRFLECADAASADFLITGNRRHFPDNHGITKILTAREFLADITTR